MSLLHFMFRVTGQPRGAAARGLQRPRENFSAADDERLRVLVRSVIYADWVMISRQMEGKNPRQCKERWYNYLLPGLNTASWTPEEDAVLLSMHSRLGAKWVNIARFLPNRTGTMTKNRFNKLRRQERKQKELLTLCDQIIFESMFQSQSGNAEVGQDGEAQNFDARLIESHEYDFWGDSGDCDTNGHQFL
jgi:hypothetical protein